MQTEATNLVQLGNFTLHSGAHTHWKLVCDRFIEENADGLAYLISQMVGHFSAVHGIPRGGLRLAQALERYAVIPHEDHEPEPYPVLLVDDVLTTGGSMLRRRDEIVNDPTFANRVIGAVLFARGKCPSWIKVVCQMPPELWLERVADAR